MLAPTTDEYAPKYRTRVLQAMQAIHNEASLTTYRLAFTISSNPDLTDPEYSQSWQEDLLDSLSSFRDSAGLHTILDCLMMAQNQRANHKPSRYPQDWWDLPNFVREEVLAPMYHPAENVRWKALITAQPKANLTAGQQAFLNSVLNRIASNPDMPPGLDSVSAAQLRTQQAAEVKAVQAEIAAAKTAPPGVAKPAP